MITFTQDEINLMCLYEYKDRIKLHEQLTYAIPDIADSELKAVAKSVLNKLELISEEAYSGLEFISTLTDEDLKRED